MSVSRFACGRISSVSIKGSNKLARSISWIQGMRRCPPGRRVIVNSIAARIDTVEYHAGEVHVQHGTGFQKKKTTFFDDRARLTERGQRISQVIKETQVVDDVECSIFCAVSDPIVTEVRMQAPKRTSSRSARLYGETL